MLLSFLVFLFSILSSLFFLLLCFFNFLEGACRIVAVVCAPMTSMCHPDLFDFFETACRIVPVLRVPPMASVCHPDFFDVFETA